MGSSAKDTITGFTELGNGILCFDPQTSKASINGTGRNVADDDSPRVIILLGWMSARAAHLQKYSDYYRTLYPNACIVVARSWPSTWFSGPRTRERYLEPLLPALDKHGLFSDNPPPVLTHLFSNGGSYIASELSRMITARKLGPQRERTNGLPASCMVFDSCPGCADLLVAIRAFTANIKSRIMKVVAGTLFLLALLVLIVIRVSTRQEHLIYAMRDRLNRAAIFPWTSTATPRLYVYSDADEMVPPDAVEEHIADARQKGLTVHAEKFHGTLHVSHARKDPERYWGAVQSLWAEAVTLSRLQNK